MVFTSLNPARETYMLWRRFSMPTKHGSKDAVAVEVKVGNELLAAYTFMLEHVVLLVWSITVLLGLVISIQKYAHDHPSRPLSKKIWRKRASPFGILKLAFKHFYSEKSTRWLIIPWLFIAVAFIVVKYTVPIIFAPYIQIGSAAPVRPDTIFLPSLVGTQDNSAAANNLLEDVSELMIPSALRAIGSVDSVMTDKSKNTSVSISPGEILQTFDNGEQVMQFKYEYNVTGLDLGLQNYPDLMLNVEGSCITDYSWWSNFAESSNTEFPGAYVDVYFAFNDTSNQNNFQPVSKYDGGPPLAHFFSQPFTGTPPDTNTTWGAIVSSVNRTSYSPSTDPWYRTFANPLVNDSQNDIALLAPLMVMPERPALSCWENDVWSYHGHTSNITSLNTIPGLKLSPGIQQILFNNLVPPMIFTLGSHLRATSLASSSTSNGFIFNANSSSIFNDLQRLVFASYIATVNTMTETTLYAPHAGFLNDVAPNCTLLEDNTSNCTLLSGTAEFVIFSNEVVTLSVRSLIVIPTIAVALWVTFLILMFLPIPGKLVAGLSPERKAKSDSEKQEIDKAEPEDLPKLNTTEAQQSQISQPKTAVSHELVVAESPTTTTSQIVQAESKKVEKMVMHTVKEKMETHTEKIAKKAVEKVAETVLDHVSDIAHRLDSAESDINSIQNSIKDSIEDV